MEENQADRPMARLPLLMVEEVKGNDGFVAGELGGEFRECFDYEYYERWGETSVRLKGV